MEEMLTSFQVNQTRVKMFVDSTVESLKTVNMKTMLKEARRLEISRKTEGEACQGRQKVEDRGYSVFCQGQKMIEIINVQNWLLT